MRRLIQGALAAVALTFVIAVPVLATSNKTTICHLPPGNPENAQTLELPPAGLRAHLGDNEFGLHGGDYLGECQSASTPTPTPTPEPTSTPAVTPEPTAVPTEQPSETPDPTPSASERSESTATASPEASQQSRAALPNTAMSMEDSILNAALGVVVFAALIYLLVLGVVFIASALRRQ